LSITLMSLSGVVLLIACLNLANMLLARGAARRKEIAIRVALGAGRGQILRQLLTEGLILSVIGGLMGLVVAGWVTDLLISSFIPRLPFLNIVFRASPDARVLAATFGFCVLATLFFGFGPAWRLTRPATVNDLKDHTGGDQTSRLGANLLAPRNLLVIAQIALSLALLTAAGLYIRGAKKAAGTTPGFRYEQGLIVELDPSMAGYDEIRGRQLYREIQERLATIPGVESLSLASLVPFGSFSEGRDVKAAGNARPENTGTNANKTPQQNANLNIITTDYFKTMGLKLLRGREFNRIEVESTQAARVAIIDEPLARALFPEQDALGQQIEFPGQGKNGGPEVLEVVGVVPGLKHELFDKTPVPHVYIPFGQQYRSGMNLHIRIAGQGHEAEAAMLKIVRKELRAVDNKLPVISMNTMQGFHDTGLLLWFVQTGANLFTAFGVLALFLAVIGIYGVKAYVVARRTREIGIRMALGATARNVLWMVLRQGLALTVAGLAIGLLLSLAVARLISSQLFEVSAVDPLTFCTTPLLLAAAALLACYVPARRAARIEPMTALRCE